MDGSAVSNMGDIKSVLIKYPNFPAKGVLFEDFLPIFKNPSLFKKLITCFKDHLNDEYPVGKIDYIVGIEARGFLFGPTLAYELGIGFVPIRKSGKLPGECVSAQYQKEYGCDSFELQVEAIPAGSNVVVVDDIIATGGTATAAQELLDQVGANILEFDFVMGLNFLRGEKRLKSPVFKLLNEQEYALKSK